MAKPAVDRLREIIVYTAPELRNWKIGLLLQDLSEEGYVPTDEFDQMMESEGWRVGGPLPTDLGDEPSTTNNNSNEKEG